MIELSQKLLSLAKRAFTPMPKAATATMTTAATNSLLKSVTHMGGPPLGIYDGHHLAVATCAATADLKVIQDSIRDRDLDAG